MIGKCPNLIGCPNLRNITLLIFCYMVVIFWGAKRNGNRTLAENIIGVWFPLCPGVYIITQISHSFLSILCFFFFYYILVNIYFLYLYLFLSLIIIYYTKIRLLYFFLEYNYPVLASPLKTVFRPYLCLNLKIYKKKLNIWFKWIQFNFTL